MNKDQDAAWNEATRTGRMLIVLGLLACMALLAMALAGCTAAPEPCLIWYDDGDGVTMTVYGPRSGDSQTYEPHHDGTVSVLDDCGEVCE